MRLGRVKSAVASLAGEPGMQAKAAQIAAGALLADGLIGLENPLDGKKSRMGIFGALLVIVTGVVVIFFTSMVTASTKAYEGGSIAHGEVVSVHRMTDAEGSTTCSATARYIVGAKTYEATTNYQSSEMCDAQGTGVDVSYRPDNPSSGRLLFATDQLVMKYLPWLGWFVLVVGLATFLTRLAEIILGVWLFLWGRRTAKQHPPVSAEAAMALMQDAWTGQPTLVSPNR
jgi:hypothetical protein